MKLIDKIIVTKGKRLSLSITDDAKAVLKTPKGVDNKTILAFIEKNKNWILTHKAKKENQINKFKDLLTNKKILLYGEELNVVFDETYRKITHNNREIRIPTKCSIDLQFYLKRYLKELLFEIIRHRIAYYENLTQINCSTYSISSARKKWGSCNTKNELKFNYRLIMLKPHLIDYVIIHELCHIREFNHSKRFWALVSVFDKNFKQHRAELKEYSPLMSIYK